jgi:hypothetical protein
MHRNTPVIGVPVDEMLADVSVKLALPGVHMSDVWAPMKPDLLAFLRGICRVG